MGNERIPFEPEQYYHLYNHGNSRDNIFIEDENYWYFLRRYQKYASLIAETYAYCLMPNHFHFLIKTKPTELIKEGLLKLPDEPTHRINKWIEKLEVDYGKFISFRLSNFFNSYSKSFNKKYERKGSLFLPNVQRKLVDSDWYKLGLVCYINCNPVLHRFTRNLLDWPYSSFQPTLNRDIDILDSQEVLRWFGGEKGFLKAHQDFIINPRGF